MARRSHGAATETLEGLEGSADRFSAWLEENIRIVVIAVALLLGTAGVVGWLATAGADDEEAASVALAKARDDYLSAMGASPGALEVPDLANPEAATQIRGEYEARFAEVAGAHAGTVAGTLAALEAAQLCAADDGRAADALARAETAAEDAPRGPVRGVALQQLAQLQESAGRWEEAAASYLRAAEIETYPLRGYALADAARSRVQAGDEAGGLELYERLESEFPEAQLPQHQRFELLDLRARLEG